MQTHTLNVYAASVITSAIAVACLTLIMLSPVRAATLDGVDLPDQTQVNGRDLVLNGLGTRTATFLKVKVYVIGLYLEQKSRNAEAIIGSDQNKRVEMHFVREVTAPISSVFLAWQRAPSFRQGLLESKSKRSTAVFGLKHWRAPSAPGTASDSFPFGA